MGQRRRQKSRYKDAGWGESLSKIQDSAGKKYTLRFQTKTKLCEEKVVGLTQIYLGWPAARNWEQPLTC